ncbi:MAG: SpoIIIAH-like family protein [Clostridia bacterium]|nr:SpoIIIAH-like family protein [Clostridia bacterium]
MKKKTIVTIVGMTIFALVAVALNWKFSLLSNLFNSGNSSDSDAPSVEAGAEVEDSYFDNARYTRTQSRTEAVSMLNEIINDDSVDEETRKKAYEEVSVYARITEGEATLESVLKAKGFEECIVFLTADTATVVVGIPELSGSQSAQIFDAVLAQTGFESGSVKIVTYPE